MTRTPGKTKKKLKKASQIVIRPTAAEFQLVEKMKEITGSKANTKNILAAAHGYLKLKKEIEDLKSANSKLEDQITSLHEEQVIVAERFIEIIDCEQQVQKMKEDVHSKKVDFKKELEGKIKRSNKRFSSKFEV